MHALDEHAAGLGQPNEVVLVRQVVPEPHDDHQDHADGERKSDIIVDELAVIGDRGEGRVHGGEFARVAGRVHGEQIASVKHDEAGQREHDETAGGQPVDGALERGEPLDAPARRPGADADTPTKGEEQREHGDRAGKAPPAVCDDRAIAEVAPIVAFGLH